MLSDQATLIRSLSRKLTHDAVPPCLFETHISWVLVTDHFAYKIKKAVRFAFLDFSTLALRRFFCQEELRLNARLSPELYLAVVAIVGTPGAPAMEAPGETPGETPAEAPAEAPLEAPSIPIEYAVKMRAFSQQAIWNARLQSGCLHASEVDALGQKLAQLHQRAAVAAANSLWGSSEAIECGTGKNLASIAALLAQDDQKEWLDGMAAWQRTRHMELSGTFDRRKLTGRVRECHGDLHCGNVLTIDGQVSVFDCIEFNESLRWIDVMDDLAFVCMDLRFQQRPDLAARLLNLYLEISGDYEGLPVFRYYQVERALVRCKVALLRAQQVSAQPQPAALQRALAARYMAFSSENIASAPLVLVIMHGFSGSGKSAVAGCLVELIGAIRLRSDVERKRLHGLPAVPDKTAAPAAELYDVAANQATYARLRSLARQAIASGLSVVVDAACLRQEQRRQFATLARELAVAFFILDVRTGEASMKARIVARAALGRDPSDAGLPVLAHQIATHEALSADELKHVIAVDGEILWSKDTLTDIAAPLIDALTSHDALAPTR